MVKPSTRRATAGAPAAPAAAPPQQDLAPAGDKVPNDEARQAIATINQQLSEFDKVEAGIGELERSYKDVAYPVATAKGMREATDARAAINRPIHATEHARKAAKAPVLKLGRDIDARAAVIDTRLRALVKPIDEQIKAEEKREADRVAAIQRRLLEIRGTPQQCIGKSAAQLALVLEGINTLPLDEFEEFKAEAEYAQKEAAAQVGTLLQQTKDAEELKAENERKRANQVRKDLIQSRIRANFTGKLSTAAMARTSLRLQALIDSCTAVVVDDTYQEFAADAREEKARVLAELVKLRDAKKIAEDAATAATAAPAAHVVVQGNTTLVHQPTAADAAVTTSAPAAPVTAAPTSAPTPPASSTPSVSRPSYSAGGGRFGGYQAAAGPATAPAPAVQREEVSRAPAPRSGRPTDVEILRVLCAHYEQPPAVVAEWIRVFDVVSALSQQALPA